MSLTVKSIGNKLGYVFWRTLLVAGFVSFLIYGLSFFVAKPTVETITTRPATIDSNSQPMRDVKFQANRKGG